MSWIQKAIWNVRFQFDAWRIRRQVRKEKQFKDNYYGRLF